MNNFYIVAIFAIIMVAFFVFTFAIGLIFKGKHMDSEIGDNPNMQKLGIKCASAQMRDDERKDKAVNDDCFNDCTDHNCSSCSSHL